MDFFDLHCDTITKCFDTGQSLFDGDREVSITKAGGIANWCQFFAIFIGDDADPDDAFDKYRDYVASFKASMDKYHEDIAQSVTAGDIDAALATGKCAAVITVENAALLNGDLNNIEKLAKDGVKVIALTWNGENKLGYGCAFSEGLKPFGKDAVKEMARHGVVADVSHLSDAGFYDVMDIPDCTVIVTHSNLRSMCGHARNLTEEQFCEIARRKGIVGLNLHLPFINDFGDPETASKIEYLFRHTDRMLELGGHDTVCIGSDFDGAAMPEYCKDISFIPYLFDEFCGRYGEEQAKKIFFGNAKAFVDTHFK